MQRIIEKTAITAGTLGGSTWGDDVSWQQLAREWLTLFSSRTLLGQIPFRKGAVNTRTLLEDSPGTAGQVGEGGGIPLLPAKSGRRAITASEDFPRWSSSRAN